MAGRGPPYPYPMPPYYYPNHPHPFPPFMAPNPHLNQQNSMTNDPSHMPPFGMPPYGFPPFPMMYPPPQHGYFPVGEHQMPPR